RTARKVRQPENRIGIRGVHAAQNTVAVLRFLDGAVWSYRRYRGRVRIADKNSLVVIRYSDSDWLRDPICRSCDCEDLSGGNHIDVVLHIVGDDCAVTPVQKCDGGWMTHG